MQIELHLSLLDKVLIYAYLIGVLVLGLRRGAKDQGVDEFLIAGRRLSLGAFVATLVSTFYGGILGVGEFTYRFGLVSWFTQGLFYYVFALIYAVLLAPKVRANMHFTLPDQLFASYNKPVGLVGALFTFILVSPAPYLLMCGTMLHLIFGWPLATAILAGAGFSLIYVLIGGFGSVVKTDILQFLMMFAGFGILLPFAWSELGGIHQILQELPAGHLGISGKLSWQEVGAWMVIALWTIVSPSFYQRCSAARSVETARLGILISIVFWFLFDMMTLSAGFYARVTLANIDPVLSYPLLAESVLPEVAKGIFMIGLLSVIMSTLDSMSFLSAITLGRDFVWRLRGGRDSNDQAKLYTQLGLIISSGLAIVIAISFQSVIAIWYLLGSMAVPVLLIPLLTSFYPRLKLAAPSVLGLMLTTGLTSVIWLIWGYLKGGMDVPSYPLGIEPMYPGLLISISWWLCGKLSSRNKYKDA